MNKKWLLLSALFISPTMAFAQGPANPTSLKFSRVVYHEELRDPKIVDSCVVQQKQHIEKLIQRNEVSSPAF